MSRLKRLRRLMAVSLAICAAVFAALVASYKAPSGSMVPTLQVGDLFFASRFHYGVYMPFTARKIITISAPQRGDVVVFRYPVNPRIYYIKRIIGLPGEEVSYRDQQLYINGKKIATDAQTHFYDEDSQRYFQQFEEKLGEASHRILVDTRRQYPLPQNLSFPFRSNCRYSTDGVTCQVPEGHYFVLGDNRDNSQDSRYWGFVPEGNIVGKAFFIWMNFKVPGRIGSID